MKKMKIILIALMVILNFHSSFSFSGKGSGTENDPFQITNINEFQEINDIPFNSYSAIMNDIDASETSYWNIGNHDGDSSTPKEPMGFYPLFFKGYLDGKGHIIYNLYINQQNAVPFSVILSSEISNLGFENLEIKGKYMVSGFCLDIENSVLNNCFTSGKLTLTSICDGYGFIFNNNDSKITNCYSIIDIDMDSSNKSNFISAFFYAASAYSSTKNCYFAGKLIDLKTKKVFGDNNICTNCFWDTEVSGIPDTNTSTDDIYARGKTTAEMYKQSTYTGWDFDSTWCIDEGKDYPKLQVFNKCTGTDVKKSETLENLDVIAIPNLTHGQTQILFYLPTSQRITIQIVNSMGIIQQVLINEEKYPAGNHSILYDATNLLDGLYFYTLKAGANVITKKFVFLK